jgi:hypothetical protein
VGFAILLALVGSGGCARPAGAATALCGILDRMGVAVVPTTTDESAGRRDGSLAAPWNQDLHERLIASFGLRRYEEDDPARASVLGRLPDGASAAEIWGVTGRPPQLRAAGDVQLESLFVVKTSDGRMILLTEYAYG